MKPNFKQILAIALILFVPTVAIAEEITVTVKGMVCSFCAQGLKKTFGKNDAIEVTDVDLEKKLVHIKTKPEKTLTDEEIRTMINDAGYEVLSVERK